MRIYYKRHGERDGRETIVLIHSNVMDHSFFNSIIPLLSEQFHVVTYDLRGFGQSRGDTNQLTIDMFVEDLSFLIDTLKLPNVHLVGIGFGALIALKYSILYEHKVKRMVVMSMVSFPEDSYDTIRGHRYKLTAGGTKLPEDMLKKTTLLSEEHPEYRRLHTIMFNSSIDVVMQIMNLSLTTQPTELMKLTKVPSLNISGQDEVFFPQYLIAYTAIYLQHFKHAVVPNSSTYVMVDQPEITAGMIITFLQQQKRMRFVDPTAIEIEEQTRMYVENLYEKGMQEKRDRNELQVDLLHYFRVYINGKQMLNRWNQRYAKEILIYLVFHPTTTREQICEDLWPELPLKMARANLRVYLSNLKNILNEEEPILVIDREHIHLEADLYCDALEFIESVKQTIQEKNFYEKYNRFRSLLTELKSSRYLTAIYDDWFLQKRDKLEGYLVHLTITMAKWLLENREQEEAEQLLKQALFIFEDNEEIYDVLIELHRELKNYDQLEYWKNEKRKTWG